MAIFTAQGKYCQTQVANQRYQKTAQHSPALHVAVATVCDVHSGKVRRAVVVELPLRGVRDGYLYPLMGTISQTVGQLDVQTFFRFHISDFCPPKAETCKT